MIIGTNALEELGFNIVDFIGKVPTTNSAKEATSVKPEETGKVDPTNVVMVELAQDLHLGPQQTRVARVRLSGND